MTLHAALKEGTREAHERLEALLGIGAPDVGLATYERYLQDTHSFYAVVEPALLASEALQSAGLDMSSRAKLPLLEADLRFLRLAPAPPAPAGLAELAVAPHVFGCAYVLEGSTLGGRMLESALLGRLGLGPARGGRFLHGYGAETATRWRELLAVLESLELDSTGRERVVEGARQTFTSLERWFAARGRGA